MKRALLRVLLLGMAGMASGADNAPAVSGARPSGFGDPGMRFGDAVEGNRIGLWNERASYGLRHLPNVQAAVEEKGKPMLPSIADYIPNVIVLPDSFVLLTHPDGSVSREQVGWPADGPMGYGWIVPIGNALYPAIQTPGLYTVRFRVADMEVGPITFAVVPEGDGFVADARLDFFEALRKARGAAAQAIRADAAKRGYEPLFGGGRDDDDETWVAFTKQFNDAHRENPGHAIVAYNKATGAVRWVPQ